MQARPEDRTRRRFIKAAASVGALDLLTALAPVHARTANATAGVLRVGPDRPADLVVDRIPFTLGGRTGNAVTVNGSVPGPLLRMKEGETVTLRVTNRLDTATSIHWHGLLVPSDMDGVPGVSFPGIAPGETFTYRFPLRQNGTYWYHSHSAFQEQQGHYGPLIVEPAGADPVAYDREHVIQLSDWTFMDPHQVFTKMKKQSGYFNYQRRTLPDFVRDARQMGWPAAAQDRLMWLRMRMDPTDILDVTGSTYTYLTNGLPPDANWTGLFKSGERVRLRFINSGASSYFNVRIPGLPMTVVQADGQNVQPVAVDEFQIAAAETYDVVVTPLEDRAYTVFAESMDRSGYARGTLAPRAGMQAAVPRLRERPVRNMVDMGMDMEMSGMQPTGTAAPRKEDGMLAKPRANVASAAPGMARGSGAAMPAMDQGAAQPMPGMDHASGAQPMPGMNHGSGAQPMPGMDHGSPAQPMAGMDHGAGAQPIAGTQQGGGSQPMPGMSHGAAGSTAGVDSPITGRHGPDTHGPGNTAVSQVQRNRLGEPGSGLAGVAHRVLVYTDLKALEPSRDTRRHQREVEMHLTGNMEAFIWGLDGKRFSESGPPLQFMVGERARITLVNDTMMEHPMHLHGVFMELDNGSEPGLAPRKHTFSVKPAERVSFDFTFDAPGNFAFHCHMLYHMEAGMFRYFNVGNPAQVTP